MNTVLEKNLSHPISSEIRNRFRADNPNILYVRVVITQSIPGSTFRCGRAPAVAVKTLQSTNTYSRL